MPDPVTFTSASARFGLPFLFAGQSQKEFSVNEAHALVDALLHCAIEGERAAPPTAPVDGECWLIGSAASGAWTGKTGQLACRQTGTWLYVPPREGLRVTDKSTGQVLCYRGGWQRPARPAVPTGGASVDSEARTAIAQLVTALIAGGILAES
ncbi:MAG: DUF2793 domain-containing protein [Croceibacterium sp.]